MSNTFYTGPMLVPHIHVLTFCFKCTGGSIHQNVYVYFYTVAQTHQACLSCVLLHVTIHFY